MINLLELLVRLELAKDERRAKSMIDGGNVCLCGIFKTPGKIMLTEQGYRYSGTFEIYEHVLRKREYEIKRAFLKKFAGFKIGDKKKVFPEDI